MIMLHVDLQPWPLTILHFWKRRLTCCIWHLPIICRRFNFEDCFFPQEGNYVVCLDDVDCMLFLQIVCSEPLKTESHSGTGQIKGAKPIFLYHVMTIIWLLICELSETLLARRLKRSRKRSLTWSYRATDLPQFKITSSLASIGCQSKSRAGNFKAAQVFLIVAVVAILSLSAGYAAKWAYSNVNLPHWWKVRRHQVGLILQEWQCPEAVPYFWGFQADLVVLTFLL